MFRSSRANSKSGLMNDSRYYQDADIIRITEHLYLSSARPVCERNLKKHGITSVISICDMPSINLGDHIDHLKIVDVLDTPNADLSLHFDSLADKIEASKKKNRRTLVHCFAGISRSATICMVYLMKYQNLTLKQAYQRVKSCRKEVRPNVGFFRQMIEFEASLYGKNSVTMIPNPAAVHVGGRPNKHFEGPEEVPDIYKAYYEPGRFQEIMHIRLMNLFTRPRSHPAPPSPATPQTPEGASSTGGATTSSSSSNGGVKNLTPEITQDAKHLASNEPKFISGDGMRKTPTPRRSLFSRQDNCKMS